MIKILEAHQILEKCDDFTFMSHIVIDDQSQGSLASLT